MLQFFFTGDSLYTRLNKPLKYMELQEKEEEQEKGIRKLIKKEAKDDRYQLPINSRLHVV